MLLRGAAGGSEPSIYDDFTQSNGTELDAYGKWTVTSNSGNTDVQSNAARLSTITGGTSQTMTSTTAPTLFVSARGTYNKTQGSNTGNVRCQLPGLTGDTLLQLGGTSIQSFEWVFFAVKVGDSWYMYMYGNDTFDRVEGASTGEPTSFNISVTDAGTHNMETTVDNIIMI